MCVVCVVAECGGQSEGEGTTKKTVVRESRVDEEGVRGEQEKDEGTNSKKERQEKGNMREIKRKMPGSSYIAP
jgi:hypothetical protein